MLDRRAFVFGSAAAVLSSCGREQGTGFEGHAFVANEDGGAVAAVNLTAFAVTRHIPIQGRPTQVIAHPELNAVWALTADAVHEIDASKLEFRRKVDLRGAAIDMKLSPDGAFLWVLLREPRRLVKIKAETLETAGTVNLSHVPTAFHLARRDGWAAVLFADAQPIVFSTDDPGKTSQLALPYQATLGAFRSDGKQLLLAGSEARQATFVTVPDGRVVAHLPLAISPKYIASKPDGGEMYLTGDGLDAVVAIYPYLAEVGETVLAGRNPSAMSAVSTPEVAYLFVTNPEEGKVTILDIITHKMVGAVSVGKEPAFLTMTPDNQYALVLNRASGDMGVIRVKAVVRNRRKQAPLFTMIPVGSRPVSAAVRGV